MTTREQIENVMKNITSLLIDKNADYGDSFRNEGIISQGLSPSERLTVRIDDKIERMRNLAILPDEITEVNESVNDTIHDLIGYLVLLLILRNEAEF